MPTLIIFFLLGLGLFATNDVQAQSTFLDSLADFTSDSERLQFISEHINGKVYSDPALSLILAHIYDSLAVETGKQEFIAKAKNIQGMAHYANAKYDASIAYYIEALNLAEHLDNPKQKARLLNNLATSYQIRGDMNKSSDYFQQALKIYQEENDSLWMANINTNLGLLLLNGEKLDEAEPYIRRALDYYSEKGLTTYQGYCMLNLGNLLNEKEDFESSIPSYQEAIQLVPETVNPLVSAAAHAGIGVAYHRLENNTQAERYLQLGLKKSQAMGHREQAFVCHKELAEVYERQQKYAEALLHYKTYTSIKDSLFTKEQDDKMIEALTKYESEKKEQEIALLSSQKEIAQARLSGSRKLLIVFGVGLLILSGLIYWLFKLNNKIQQGATEKETLLKEIHHRVKNNLQVISALLTLQSKYIKDDHALEALKEGHDRVQSMALIHRDLYQHDNLKGVNTKEYLEKLVASLLESYKIGDQAIKLHFEIEELWLDVDTMIPLGLMINELISNSLKHAFVNQKDGRLSIYLKEADGKLKLKIADNGKGNLDFGEPTNDSFGYSLINSFAKRLEADMSFSNHDGFSIELDIKEFSKAA